MPYQSVTLSFAIYFIDVDAEAEEVLNELNSLTEGEDASSNAPGKTFSNDVRRSLGGVKDDDIDASLGLGELAQLTVNLSLIHI